jgi:hypothetical protein
MTRVCLVTGNPGHAELAVFDSPKR